MKQVEIERKWLMDGFPPLSHIAETQQEQGYLCFRPNTVRIRKSVCKGQTSHWLTIKGHGGLQRTEVELSLQAQQYEALCGLLVAPMARKRHRLYTLPGGHTLECSLVDEGEPGCFYYAEVEFDTLQQARDFVPPAFLGREVTEEPGYTMAAHCMRKGEKADGCKADKCSQ